MKQLADADPSDLHIRLYWPGKTASTQFGLKQLRDRVEVAAENRETQSVLSFEVLQLVGSGSRFGQRRNFIADLEAGLPRYYENVTERLKAWQPAPPKLEEGKGTSASVSTEALRQEAEKVAFDMDA